MAQEHSTIDNDLTMGNAKSSITNLLNAINSQAFEVRYAASLANAVAYSTTHPGAMVLCPNGILINGMMVGAPDQEIGFSVNGNNVRLTVDGVNTDIVVPYATKALTDENGLQFSINYSRGINAIFGEDNGDGTVTIKYTTILTNPSGTDASRAATLGTFMYSSSIFGQLNDIKSQINDIKSAQTQGMVFMGTIGADTKITSFNTTVGGEDMRGVAFANISGDVNVKSGWTFRNTVAQDLASSIHVEPGDMIMLVNNVPNNRAIIPTDYTIVQNNIDKATADSLGLVKIGDNINVDNNGTISVPAATKNAPGVVKVGGTLDVNNGTINAPTMTSERAGIAAVGENLQMQTGHLGIKKSKGLESDSNGSLRVSDPVVRAYQSGGSAFVGVKIGPTGNDTNESSAAIPLVTDTAAGLMSPAQKAALEQVNGAMRFKGYYGYYFPHSNVTPEVPDVFIGRITTIGAYRCICQQAGSGSYTVVPFVLQEIGNDNAPTDYYIVYNERTSAWERKSRSSLTLRSGGNFMIDGGGTPIITPIENWSSPSTYEVGDTYFVVSEDNTYGYKVGDLLISTGTTTDDIVVIHSSINDNEKLSILYQISYLTSWKNSLLWIGTQAQYDAIATKSNDTIYLITDTQWYDQYATLTDLITALNNQGIGNILSISVAGTAITPSAQKNVNIPIADGNTYGVSKHVANNDYSIGTQDITIAAGNESDVPTLAMMKAWYDHINNRMKAIESALTWKSVD